MKIPYLDGFEDPIECKDSIKPLWSTFYDLGKSKYSH